MTPASLKTPEALALLEAVTHEPCLLQAMPGRESKQTLRFYTGFNGHYTGAIVGAVWFALDDPLNDTDAVELSPVALALRFNTAPGTIRKALQRLCAGGFLVKTGRNTYRATKELTERINGGGFQYINNDVFFDSPNETPRTLAAKSAAETAQTDAETARRFKVHRSTISRLTKRDRTQQKAGQNATSKAGQNATKSETERNTYCKVVTKGTCNDCNKDEKPINQEQVAKTEHKPGCTCEQCFKPFNFDL